jgi:uncharacterized protein (TIGR02466 family)
MMIHDIFPIKIYSKDLEITSLERTEMLEVIQFLIEQDDYQMQAWTHEDDGKTPSKPLEYEASFPHFREVGKTAISTVTHQPQQLHDYPEFNVLNQQVTKCAEEFWKENEWRKDLTPVVSGSWAVKHERGDYTSLHSHGRNDISSVFYFKVPEESGDLLLLNPLEYIKGMEAYSPGYETGHQYSRMKAIEGRVYMWPSWLKHKTQASDSDAPRVSMPYNFVGVPFENVWPREHTGSKIATWNKSDNK